MDLQDIATKMNAAQAWLPGKKVKLVVGEEGALMLDGQASQVTTEDGAADTTLKASAADWEAMFNKQLDGMTAVMQGLLTVVGEMSNAMHLQGVLSKVG